MDIILLTITKIGGNNCGVITVKYGNGNIIDIPVDDLRWERDNKRGFEYHGPEMSNKRIRIS
jgi:hypothetical protein